MCMQKLHVRQVHTEAAKNNYNYKYINTYIYKDRRGEYHPIPHDEARGQGRQKEDGFFPGWEKLLYTCLTYTRITGIFLNTIIGRYCGKEKCYE